jgi:hypothetical protein
MHAVLQYCWSLTSTRARSEIFPSVFDTQNPARDGTRLSGQPSCHHNRRCTDYAWWSPHLAPLNVYPPVFCKNSPFSRQSNLDFARFLLCDTPNGIRTSQCICSTPPLALRSGAHQAVAPFPIEFRKLDEMFELRPLKFLSPPTKHRRVSTHVHARCVSAGALLRHTLSGLGAAWLQYSQMRSLGATIFVHTCRLAGASRDRLSKGYVYIVQLVSSKRRVTTKQALASG